MSKFIEVKHLAFHWNRERNKCENVVLENKNVIICIENITKVTQCDATMYDYGMALYRIDLVDRSDVTISEIDYRYVLLPAMDIKDNSTVFASMFAKRMLNSMYGKFANYNYNDTDNVKPITTQRKIISRGNIDSKWKWIARDKHGEVYAYKTKPVRRSDFWDTAHKNEDCVFLGYDIDNYCSALKDIKWEDEEPTELVDNCVMESE